MAMAKPKIAMAIDFGMSDTHFRTLLPDKIIDDFKGFESKLNDETSMMAFTGNGRIVGDITTNGSEIDPRNVVFDLKRLLGQTYDDARVQADVYHWPFKLVSKNGMVVIQIDGYLNKKCLFYPEELLGMMLEEFRKSEEKRLGIPITGAVIAFPNYFNETQKQAYEDGCRIAGLNLLEKLDEPIAAVTRFARCDLNMRLKLQANVPFEENVLFYDLGGGKFDVYISTINQQLIEKPQVRAIRTDPNLGGVNFDLLLLADILSEFKRNNSQNVSRDKMYQLRFECQKAKHRLSTELETTVCVENFLPGIDLRQRISRTRFEELCFPLFQKTIRLIESLLSEARLTKDDIHKVVLTGLSTQIPKVQELLNKFFAKSTIFPVYGLVAYSASDRALYHLNAAQCALFTVDYAIINPKEVPKYTSLININDILPVEKTLTITSSEEVLANILLRFAVNKTDDLGIFGLYDMIGTLPATLPNVELNFRWEKHRDFWGVSAIEETGQTFAAFYSYNRHQCSADGLIAEVKEKYLNHKKTKNTKTSTDKDGQPATVIGIDFGTTYSSVGLFENNQVKIIANDDGNLATPSVIAFTEYKHIVGDYARDLSETEVDYKNVIFDIKRLAGQLYADPHVQTDIKYMSCRVVNLLGRPHIKIDGHLYGNWSLYPEFVAGMIIESLKKQAEDYLGRPVAGAVIAVPAHFNDSQRQAIRTACHIAQLKVFEIVDEPMAAAIAYDLDRDNTPATVLIYDLGGGTFDMSIIQINSKAKSQPESLENQSRASNIKMLSIGGDSHLGGVDFDTELLKHILGEFKRKHNKEPDSFMLRLLRLKCEKVKKSLSKALEATIIMQDFVPGIELKEKITRPLFEKLCSPLFEKTLTIVEDTLKKAELTKDDIDEVIMIGGSSRIPKVQELVKEFFPNKVRIRKITSDEVVAYGATVRAAELQNSSIPEKPVTIATIGYSLSNDCFDNKLIPMINRTTPLPCKKTVMINPLENNPKIVAINIHQGESDIASKNSWLAMLPHCNLIQPAGSLPNIELTMSIDDNGILTVTTEEELGNKRNVFCTNIVTTDLYAIMDKKFKECAQDYKKQYFKP